MSGHRFHVIQVLYVYMCYRVFNWHILLGPILQLSFTVICNMQLCIVFLYMILPVTDVAFVKSRHETFRIAGNLC